MVFRTVKKLRNLKGKRVLVRVDLNIPLKTSTGEEWKLERIIPTIKFLQERKARVILLSHLGRPDGKKDATLSLRPIGKRLSKVLGTPVEFASDCVGPKAVSAVKRLKPGKVLLLENLRFHLGEEENDQEFARALASLGDIFVNDGFAVSHRSHASVVGLPRLLPHAAGLLLEGEVKALTKLMKNPKRPFVVLIGGAKISSKLEVIKTLLKKADKILMGTAMCNTLLLVKGCAVGGSMIDPEMRAEARKLLREKKIILPVDVVIGSRDNPKTPARVVRLPSKTICGRRDSILDIGPETIRLFAGHIRQARTLVWNGPVGMFEIPKFAHGSLALGRLIASRASGPAFGVVGGGETVAALQQTGMVEFVDWVSTGGGAMLEFLEGKKLPGLKILNL